MRKKVYFLIGLFILIGVTGIGIAKAQESKRDPKNVDAVHKELTIKQSYKKLTKDTVDFNGMDFETFSLDCKGEDLLEKTDDSGEYEDVIHTGIKRTNYSKEIVNRQYICTNIDCPSYNESFNMLLYKAYTVEEFKNKVIPYPQSKEAEDWCGHAVNYYIDFLKKYEPEQIRESAENKTVYYVYQGMPVDIPVFTLVTSIEPGSKDLWVGIFSPDNKLGLYNAGVYQIFDSNSPHIKHTASLLNKNENELKHTTEVFKDVRDKSLNGNMYYDAKKVTSSVYQYFLVCNNCSTCERCSTSNYGNLNTYVAYGEIPELYLSRGCPTHSCCFVYDYPVSLPDEYEGVKCPDLKIEGDIYIACKSHTCERWLEHSDYRATYAPQSCLKVTAGRVVTDSGSGVKDIRYTGPVDKEFLAKNDVKNIGSGYSEYCANHMCSAFLCDKSKEDSESYAAKYDKKKNEVTMANKYCSEHKSGCKVVNSYVILPEENKTEQTINGEVVEVCSNTIMEQLLRDKKAGAFKLCNKTVTQSFYAFSQPNTMICEDCYDLMAKNKLNSDNSTKNLNVGNCSNCGDLGVTKFKGEEGNWCVTCLDFHRYKVSHRNISKYDYSNVKGVQREKACEFNIQRFLGDNSSLCGERCVENRKYCSWHLCATEDCVEPVKYNGAYFCEKCVPSR